MSEEKKKRGRKKKLDRLDRMCLYCADYNKKHGTNYKLRGICSANRRKKN